MDLVTIISIVASLLLGGVFVVATLWGRLARGTRTMSALSVLRRKLLGLSKTRPDSGPELFSDDNARFMQLAHILTDLVPKILLDVLTNHITSNKVFQDGFDKKPWDGGQEHRKWLASVMEMNPRVKDFSCAAVRNKPASEWDVTNLSAALSVVMDPSGVPCAVDVNQWCGKKTKKPMEYFEVDVGKSERADCKSWEGFSINVTGASPPEVVECVVTEAPSDTKVVAVSREKAKDRDLPNKIKKGDSTDVRPVNLPLPEVQDIVKVRQSRNALYHRSKTEVSGDEFTQCVASVRRLIEQAFPKEVSNRYLAELDTAADTETFKQWITNGKNATEERQILEHMMEELREQGEQGEELRMGIEALLEGFSEKIEAVKTKLQGLQQGQEEILQRQEVIQCGQKWQMAVTAEVLACVQGFEQRQEYISRQLEPKGPDEGLTSGSKVKKENCLYDSPLALEYIELVTQIYSKMPITQGSPDVDYVRLKVIRSHPSEHKKEDTAQFLRNFQKATVDYISQWDGDGPVITQKDQVMSGLVTHDHFLQQQEKQLHILFGPPGMGKTSFSRQICSQFSSAPKSSSFSLVLLFYVREKRVAEAKTLADLLSCYSLPDDDLDHNELARLIVKSKGKGLQIIFDGLDERPGLLKDDESIVTKLMKGQLAEAQIVVTSRPGIVTQLSELWHMASLYEVQGFGPQEVKEYVESFFRKKGDPSATSKFCSALANRPDLTGSTYIPLNLWLLCSVFSYKDCTLPDTLTQCYTALFAKLLRHQAKKEGVELFTGLTLDGLPESMQTTLDCLSKLSYDCFLKQELVFDEEVVIHTCLSSRAQLKHTFDGMSLLSVHPKQHGDMDHLTFNFLHSTYQEYLCAKHIHGMSKEEQTAFWKENISNPRYATVFRFYCGLSQLQIKGVQDLVKGQKLPSVCHDNDRHLLFLFYALHESGNTDLTAAIASQLDGALVFQLKMSLYDFYVTGHCLSKAVHLTKLDFGTVYTQETTDAIPCMESVAFSNPLLSLRLALTELSLLDAEKLTSALSALEELTLTLDVSSGDAIEEVLFVPTLKKLHLTVGSDSDWYTSLHPTSKSGVTDLDLDFPSKGLAHSCSQMEELRVVCDSKDLPPAKRQKTAASQLQSLISQNVLSVGASCILDVGSQPTLEEMDKLIVGRCSRWDQAALCLGVQPYVIEYERQGNPNNVKEACRRVLHRWLLCVPGTGETKRRTWHSVLEALETSGHSQLASQLKRDNFAKSSEEPISLSSQPVSSVDVGDVIASHLSKWKNLRKVEVWSMNPVPILWSTVSCDELVEVVIGDPKYCKVPADVGSMPVDLSAAHLRRLELLWTYGGDSEVLRTCLSIVSTCSSLEELDIRCGTPDAGQVIASHLPKWKNLRKVAVLFLNPMPILLSVRLCGKLDEVVIKYPEHCKPTAEDWQAVAVTMASAQQLKKMELWGIDVPFLETCIPKLSSCPSLQELRVHSQDPSAGQVLADNVLLLQSVETLSIRDINPKPILQVLSRNSKHSVSSMGISLEHKPDLLFGVCDLLSQCRTIRSFQLYLNKGPEALTALSHCLEGLCRSPSIEEVSISCLDTGAGPAVAQLLPNMVGHPVKLSVSLPDPTDVLESLQDSSVASLTLVMSHLRPMTPHDQVRLQALVSGVKSEKVSIVLKQEQQFPYNPWILHDISLARLAFISSVMK